MCVTRERGSQSPVLIPVVTQGNPGDSKAGAPGRVKRRSLKGLGQVSTRVPTRGAVNTRHNPLYKTRRGDLDQGAFPGLVAPLVEDEGCLAELCNRVSL